MGDPRFLRRPQDAAAGSAPPGARATAIAWFTVRLCREDDVERLADVLERLDRERAPRVSISYRGTLVTFAAATWEPLLRVRVDEALAEAGIAVAVAGA